MAEQILRHYEAYHGERDFQLGCARAHIPDWVALGEVESPTSCDQCTFARRARELEHCELHRALRDAQCILVQGDGIRFCERLHGVKLG